MGLSSGCGWSLVILICELADEAANEAKAQWLVLVGLPSNIALERLRNTGETWGFLYLGAWGPKAAK